MAAHADRLESAAADQMHAPPAPAPAPQSHGDVATGGFRGAAHEVPYRAEMERSFGVDLGGVQAYTDPGAAASSRGLGAHAYAVGNQVAFGTSNPDRGLVAHELTHVLQHGDGAVSRKAANAGDSEIDNSGETEAERVESAVRAGKPATSALDGGAVKDGGARLRSGRGIARKEAGGGTPFTFGMTFSPEGLEKQYWWNLWSAPEFEVPIPAVPGLNFKISPEVKVLAAGGLNWREKSLETQLKLMGIVGMGLSYGRSEVAEFYGVMEANAAGGFDYSIQNGGEEHAEPAAAHAPAGHAPAAAAAHAPPKHWSLSGNIALSTDFAVGVELAGGWLDYRFEFGDCNIGTLTGLAWKDGHFDRSAVGWQWGEKPKEFFAAVRNVIAKAEQLQRAGGEAYRNGMNAAKRAGQTVFKSGRDVMQWVSSW